MFSLSLTNVLCQSTLVPLYHMNCEYSICICEYWMLFYKEKGTKMDCSYLDSHYISHIVQLYGLAPIIQILFWHFSQLSQQYYFNTYYSIKQTNKNLLFIIFYFIFCIIRIFQEHLQVFEPLRKYLLEHYNFHQ